MPIDKVPDGDGGTAIGPLQISRAYHADAWGGSWGGSGDTNGNGNGNGNGVDAREDADAADAAYERCRELAHAERTCAKYWMTFSPCAVHDKDFEVLARAHNGGIRGVFEHYGTTPDYHAKIRAALRGAKRRDRAVTAAAFLALASACCATARATPPPSAD